MWTKLYIYLSLFFFISMALLYALNQAGAIEYVNETNIMFAIDYPNHALNATPIFANDGNVTYIELPGTNYTFTGIAPTGSMRPVLDHGNFVVLKPVNENTTYSPGEIIVYNDGPEQVIHYIINTTECIRTRGINLVGDGYCIDKKDIVSKAVAVIWS